MSAEFPEYNDFVHELVKFHQLIPYVTMEISQHTGNRVGNGIIRQTTSVSITKQLESGLQLSTTTSISQKDDNRRYNTSSTISVARTRQNGPAWFLTISIGTEIRWFIDGNLDAAKRDILFLKLLMAEKVGLDEHHVDVKIFSN